MATYEYLWEIKVYDLTGALLGSVTEATERRLHFPLNGIDSLEFTMYLDDPFIDPSQGGDITKIRPLDRVLRVWRTVTDVTNPVSPVVVYADPSGTPGFAGYITRVDKSGAGNTVSVLAQNPLWRLQSRFHILNHYLVIDYAGQADADHEGGNQDGLAWDISALMFRHIDLVNGAFGGNSKTGIRKPTGSAPHWTKTLAMGPWRIAKGDNTWVLFSTLLDQIGGPDLTPEYIFVLGQPDLMYFKTATHRGTDKSGTVSFDYYTGNKNLDDFDELEEVNPDRFGNYVWATGQGGANVTLAKALDINTTPLGYNNIGVYMHLVTNETIETGTGSVLQDNANAELAKVDIRPKTYSLVVSPLTLIYGLDFTLGDIVKCNASKGALSVTNLKQRIYEATLTISDNNVEMYDLVVATDFFSKVPLV